MATNAPFTLTKLKIEIEVMNPGDYSGLSDAEIADKLNEKPSTVTGGPFIVDRQNVEASEIVGVIPDADWPTSVSNLIRLQIILDLHTIPATPEVRSVFASMFSGPTATMLNALTQRDGSRAEDLWGYAPNPSEVANAGRLP